ncbi:hypothetical protein [Myroides odoratimimus]|uniref:hypothetical protein n=1 Tax=Myroides odoratimimus TaxID=76832 RepID=UPI0025755C15|nr:hypothetical protein [Myroides odoratimimus]MDM1415679.1 hypothetical protein [Myroides odoratimimus]
MNKKEFGSDFYSVINSAKECDSELFFNGNFSYTFSGRSALYAIIELGIKNKGWKSLLVPSYYCLEVYDFITSLDICIDVYNCLPTDDYVYIDEEWNTSETAVLEVNYFGVKKPLIVGVEKAFKIYDVTHNLLEVKSTEENCYFASLRKCLPLGVGGFFQSLDKDLVLNLINTDFANEVGYKKQVGMFLKKLYLEGSNLVTKDLFRNILSDAEECFSDRRTFSSIPKLTRVELEQLNVLSILSLKKRNIQLAKKILKKRSSFELLTSDDNTDFALVFLFKESAVRDSLRQYLVDNKVYPMVLWPNQKGEKEKDFEAKVLFVHMDFRHSERDIKFIIGLINNFFHEE